MKRLNSILKNNQSGFAYLLTVVVLSATVLTSLSLVYVYSINRLRYQTRIKEAYKLLNVTESAAKTVKSAWDKAVIASPGDTDANYATAVNNTLAASVDTTCKNTCQSAYSIDPNTVTMCFPNQDNSNLPYCFTGGSVQTSQLDFNLVEPIYEFGKFEKFIAKLDHFFNDVHLNQIDHITFSKPTLLGWVFNSAKAFAVQAGGLDGGTTQCPSGMIYMRVGDTNSYSCQCTQGYVFNGSTCVSSTSSGATVNPYCIDQTYAAANPDQCQQLKIISPNTQANCNQTPKPSSCARCVSSDGANAQNSVCGVVSARLPGTSDTVNQTFRISKTGDLF